MSLTQSDYTFEGVTLHGSVKAGPFDASLVIGRFPGVSGESHLTNPPGGRDLACPVTYYGYASEALLQAAVDRIHAKEGTLTGDLVSVNGAGGSRTEKRCTFVGFEEDPRGFHYSPSVPGLWMVRGVLRWRQRGRNGDAL